MRRAKMLALLLAIYLGVDFVDASAPSVFVFDSAFFLGTVVQSKMRSADAVDHRPTPTPLPMHGSPVPAAHEPLAPVRRPVILVETYAPLPRDTMRRASPPRVFEDH
jgi:hypothetical protein